MTTAKVLAASALVLALGIAEGRPAETDQYGSDPKLPAPHRGLLPTMQIANPTPWGDRKPTAPQGYTVTAIATDLKIPRQILVLPNGDLLVAEGRGGGDPTLTPKDFIAGIIKARGVTHVQGGNRLTLLHDKNGDGTYAEKTVFAEGLNAPYGMALVGNQLFVANQDALVRFDYHEGQTRAEGPPVKVTDLPSIINHHWTKALAASADGTKLYVGIGSNSNITERGMVAEVDRARIWEVDVSTGAHRAYATGTRNPTALAIQPGTGQLWAVANERDELGSDLVPDYLTSIKDGGFYGWPYSYWGQNVDTRVHPQDPAKVASAIKPDYSLGSHVAALGVSFAAQAMGQKFADGVFVGEHGSWNRASPSGYKVVFVPFSNGRPSGPPVDFLTGFMGADGKTYGRPVGVTVDGRGALLVADDLSNTVWRVAPQRHMHASDTQPR
ncbi:MAG: sorbosone dehydrogenase family protein [Hyphomicrobiales bacterium]|nr:MAG: sorbosone dehydrogenase family protein [Hyphomicrobiales bacterium]